MEQTTQTPTQQTKKPSTGSSKTGALLSVLALIFSAIGSALVHAKYKSNTPVTTTAEKVGEATSSGVMHILSVLFSIPLLVAGIGLGLIAIIFILIRLRKVKAMGLIMSVVWVLISIWAIKISVAAFQVIKAH